MLNLDRLRDPGRFGPWLGGIGLNLCRRHLRERSQPLRADWSEDVLSGGRWAAEPVATGPDPQELAEEADLAGRVRQAVARLPTGQRTAVLLFYLSGLTYAETAAQLGIELNAVKTRLHKARGHLRDQLIDFWEETTIEMKTPQDQAVPVRVADVRRRPAEGDTPAQFIVILEEVGGERRLPIWMGQTEATAIALQLEKRQWTRPSTYAFTAGLLNAIGGRLREVTIAKLDDGKVFYAVAVVEGGRKMGTVDARPSDAINLALSTGAPIRVEPAVFAANAAIAKNDSADGHSLESTQGLRDIVAEVEALWKGSLTASTAT
jgi:uncharacterized protein